MADATDRIRPPAGSELRGETLALAELRESVAHDYATSTSGGIVPLNRRRSSLALSALWLSMNCGFGEIFIGSALHAAGFSLGRAIAVSLIAPALYLIYALPAAYLGSRTGQTHALLSRSVFGKIGLTVVAVCLFVEGAGFVGFQAGITGEIYDGLYNWGHLTLIAVLLAIVMITNNVFGFSGVVAWARYIVTPIVILWIGYMMIRGFATEPLHVITKTPPVITPLTFWAGIGAIIGVITWGDEPDFWRYGQPRFWWSLPGYLIGLVVGDVFFIVGGWMMGQLSSTSTFSASVLFVTKYSLFGLLWLAFIVGTVSQVAAQDGNYYVAINALQNVFGDFAKWKRIFSCAIAAAGGAFFTWVLLQGTNAWLYFVTFSSAAVPAATVIMIIDHYVVPRWFGISRPLDRVPRLREAGLANLPAIIAMAPAIIIGTFGAGVVPGFTSQYWYLPGPFSWVAAGITYLAGVAIVSRGKAALSLLGFQRFAQDDPLARSSAIRDMAADAEKEQLASAASG
jgi:purine-cytosine permease-like protein